MTNTIETIGAEFEARFERARLKAKQHVLNTPEFQMLEVFKPEKAAIALALLNQEMDKKENAMRGKIYEQISTQPDFVEACKKANIMPSIRQASKFYKGEGAAWTAFCQMVHAMELTIDTEKVNVTGDTESKNG